MKILYRCQYVFSVFSRDSFWFINFAIAFSCDSFYFIACFFSEGKMKRVTDIYFNDSLVAYTDRVLTYERENEKQKEYRFTNTVSLLSASLFCEELELFENDNIIVEIL
jgi:hypothetical protein